MYLNKRVSVNPFTTDTISMVIENMEKITVHVIRIRISLFSITTNNITENNITENTKETVCIL